jgi:hypothetical protein
VLHTALHGLTVIWTSRPVEYLQVEEDRSSNGCLQVKESKFPFGQIPVWKNNMAVLNILTLLFTEIQFLQIDIRSPQLPREYGLRVYSRIDSSLWALGVNRYQVFAHKHTYPLCK